MEGDNFYSNSSSAGVNEEQNCDDMNGGFQDVDPQIFCIMADIAGALMSGNLPFNVQNAIGNWLMLVGQTIVTYNAQQQYFQNGPGRYYNEKYRNVTNPFCSTTASTPDVTNEVDIENLRKQVQRLTDEVQRLKERK